MVVDETVAATPLLALYIDAAVDLIEKSGKSIDHQTLAWQLRSTFCLPGGYLREAGLTGFHRQGPQTGPPPAIASDEIDMTISAVLDRFVQRVWSGNAGNGDAIIQVLRRLRKYIGTPPSRRQLFRKLVNWIDGEHQSNTPSLVLLGPPGIGKTYLIFEAVRYLRYRRTMLAGTTPYSPFLLPYYKCPQTERPPYSAYANLLYQILNFQAENDGTDIAHLLEHLVSGEQFPGYTRTVLSTILPAGCAPFSWTQEPPAIETRKPENMVAVLSRVWDITAKGIVGLRDSTGHTACVRLSVVLDDIQWIDRQSWVVLTHLSRTADGVRLILIGRSELPLPLDDSENIEIQNVGPLTEGESDAFAHFLCFGIEELESDPTLIHHTVVRSHGSPLAIQQMIRNASQALNLGTRYTIDSRTIDISELSSAERRFILCLSALGPPVPDVWLQEITGFSLSRFSSVSQTLTRYGLITRHGVDGLIRFTHDLVEVAVKEHVRQNSDIIADAIQMVKGKARQGETLAMHTLARILSSGEMDLTDTIPLGEIVLILRNAAKRSLDLVVADDALRFAQTALVLNNTNDGRNHPVSAETLELHEIAHHAAFLLDDGAGMSRHFQYIKATGSLLHTNRARTVWITRAYAKLRVRGSLNVGWKALCELGTVPVGALDDVRYRKKLVGQAGRFLLLRSPEVFARRIREKGPATDPRCDLVSTIAANLLLPMASTYPEGISLLAWVILSTAIRYGSSGFTGFGFICWSILATHQERSVRRRQKIGEYALTFAGLPAEPTESIVSHHVIQVFSYIASLHWEQTSPETERRLFILYGSGVRRGVFEAAAHAVHAALSHGLFFRGYPLQTLQQLYLTHRETVDQLGLDRVSRAMAKFQQGVDCLLGQADDAGLLTGTVTQDGEVLETATRRGDSLSVSGYHAIRGILGLCNGSFEDALEHFRFHVAAAHRIDFMFNIPAVWFFHSMVAIRLGKMRDFRKTHRVLRRLRHTPDGRYRHLALQGELLNRFGLAHWRDQKLYNAVRQAVASGFYNAAAYIAERHGELLRAERKDRFAKERFLAARELYHRWGAVIPIARVDAALEELSEEYPPILPGETTVNRGVSLPSATSEVQERLRETTRNAALLFETVTDSLILADISGRVHFHNPHAQDFIAIRPDGVLHFREEIWPHLKATVKAAVLNMDSRELQVDLANRTIRASVNATPASGETPVVAVVIRDVTEERERENAMIIADRMASLGMLAATVAHEVGNPNHIIRLNAQNIELLVPAMDVDVREAVSSILMGTEQIHRVVRQVTEYARDGRSDERLLVHPTAICERVVRFSRLLVQRYTNDLLYEPVERLPEVFVFSGQIEQALINLIRNACVALPDRLSRIRMAVEHRTDREGDDWVVFSISDQGVGFDPERIDIFQTTRSNAGGTGLGLPIVQSIVERHGGRFRFTRDEMYTTVAEIHLPSSVSLR
jgi:signal transduction histidine kinase